MRRLGLVLFTSLLGVVLFAGTAHAGTIVRHNAESASKVRHYWTADRMREAVPLGPVERSGPPRPLAKPGSGSGGTTSVEVTVPPGSALTAQGKVFFTAGSTNYVCSGTALAGDVVWTAGHCVNEGPGVFYTKFLFVPAYRDGTAPYGKFPASTLLTTGGWLSGGEFGVDVGAAVPSTNAAGQTLSEAVVERSIVFGAARNQSYSVYGYPAAKRFSGQRLRVCNTAWSLDDTSATPATMGVPCDMTGGSSGGGWITAAGSVASVVSYGYPSYKNVLFGPHLETAAQQLYNDAVAASP